MSQWWYGGGGDDGGGGGDGGGIDDGGGGGGATGTTIAGTATAGCRVGTLGALPVQRYRTCLSYSIGGQTVQLAYSLGTTASGAQVLNGALLLPGNTRGNWVGMGVGSRMIGSNAIIAHPLKGAPTGALAT